MSDVLWFVIRSLIVRQHLTDLGCYQTTSLPYLFHVKYLRRCPGVGCEVSVASALDGSMFATLQTRCTSLSLLQLELLNPDHSTNRAKSSRLEESNYSRDGGTPFRFPHQTTMEASTSSSTKLQLMKRLLVSSSFHSTWNIMQLSKRKILIPLVRNF